jgi:hypothetical protein
VGEEYDGGEIYSGVNAAHQLNKLPWAHWLTYPNRTREEKEILRVQE